MNIFQKGGKATDAKLIKGIQKILGVDDQQMSELWKVGLEKYGSEEGIGEALNEAMQGLTQASSEEEVKAAIVSVFTPESQIFKCGGKMHKLSKKMAKGNKVDCGCGGIKVKFEKGNKVGRHQTGGIVIAKEDPIRNFRIQKDSTWVNNGVPGREVVIVSPNPNGNAFSLITQGPDSSATAGSIENGKYIPNGEITVLPKYLDAAIKLIKPITGGQQKQDNTKSMQDGGELGAARNQLQSLLVNRGWDTRRINDTINRTMANMQGMQQYSNLSGEELELAAYKALLGNNYRAPKPTIDVLPAAPVGKAIVATPTPLAPITEPTVVKTIRNVAKKATPEPKKENVGFFGGLKGVIDQIISTNSKKATEVPVSKYVQAFNDYASSVYTPNIEQKVQPSVQTKYTSETPDVIGQFNEYAKSIYTPDHKVTKWAQ